MRLKAGLLPFGENEEDWEDATWDYQGAPFAIDILDNEGNLVMRIDPQDLIAITDAVTGKLIRTSNIDEDPNADLN